MSRGEVPGVLYDLFERFPRPILLVEPDTFAVRDMKGRATVPNTPPGT